MSDLLHVLPTFPTGPHSHLIPSLERSHVTTTDLLTLTPAEVAKRAQLPLLDVRRLCDEISAALRRELELGQPLPDSSSLTPLTLAGPELASRWSTISTLDPTLDAALNGGFATGYVTEITGESGAGKTQLLLLLLLSAQLPPSLGGLSSPTLYLSTEHPLPTTRLHSLIASHPLLSSLPPTTTRPSLSNIQTIHFQDLESQSHILSFQVPLLLSRLPIRLIVLDSVAANYRAEFARTSTTSGASGGPASLAQRSASLIKLGQELRDIARRFNVAVVVANQVSDRFSPIPPPTVTTVSAPPPATTTVSAPQSSASAPSSTAHTHESLYGIHPRALNGHPSIRRGADAAVVSDDVLSLDHQQNWFTGWNAFSPASTAAAVVGENLDLKTPALGHAWSLQVGARVALVKRRRWRPPGRGRGVDVEEGSGGGVGRFMKVVFAPWAAPSSSSSEKEKDVRGAGEPVGEGEGEDGVEFVIGAGGLSAVVPATAAAAAAAERDGSVKKESESGDIEGGVS